MRKSTLGFAVLSGLSLLAAQAFAQGSPSADSIINSLRPGSGMTGGTRGLRPMAPVGSPPPSAAPSSSPAPRAAVPRAGTPVASPGTRAPAPPPPSAAETGAPSVNLTVQFRTNSAELTPAATHTLDELGRALSSQQLSAYHFRIEGHTDTVGNPDANQRLSEQRANAVLEYLVSKFGIDRNRLEAVGMGESHLLVPTGAGAAEPRNRRVTVVNVGS